VLRAARMRRILAPEGRRAQHPRASGGAHASGAYMGG
jgi:hypothetical protein